MTEIFWLPAVGHITWLCASAAFVFGFIMVQASSRDGRIGSLAMAIVLVLSMALSVGWLEMHKAVGDAPAALITVVVIASGTLMMLRLLVGEWHSQVVQHIGLACAAFLTQVAGAFGLDLLGHLCLNCLPCDTGGCSWYISLLRLVVWLVFSFLTLLELAGGLGPLLFLMTELADDSNIFQSLTWLRWFGTCTVVLAYAETAVIASLQVHQTGAWVLASVAAVPFLLASVYCYQQMVLPGLFPCLMPHLTAVAITIWAGRTFVEMLAAANGGTVPHYVQDVLSFGAFVVCFHLSGLLAVGLFRIQQERRRRILTAIAMVSGILAGVAACLGRSDETVLWDERLIAAVCGAAVLAGSTSFHLGCRFSFTKQ